MTPTTLTRILAIGSITGMRSMSGPAVVVAPYGGIVRGMASLMAAGEMAADKTEAVGNRTDALPLSGRAVIGGVLGGLTARDSRESMLLGAMVGASAAIIAAHVANRLRLRFSSTVASGLVEDAIVLGAGMLYTRYAPPLDIVSRASEAH